MTTTEDQDGVDYQSETFSDLTVELADGDDLHFRGVRVALLHGGALKVYRDRSFDDAVPFERVIAAGGWLHYNAC